MIFFLASLIFNSALLFADSVDSWGTEAYVEMEYRIPLTVHTEMSTNRISQYIFPVIEGMINDKSLQFFNALGSRVELTSFKKFIFKDIYFDTITEDLFSNEMIYRLRYRWSSPWNFFMYQWLPGVKHFFPNRCEVQYKRDYHFDKKSSVVQAIEQRFEFRDGSEPFIGSQKAPSAPWLEEEYIQYARHGSYKKFIMGAYQSLIQQLPEKRIELLPQVELITQRNRAHILARNPWGVAPNPEQIFIISIDKTKPNKFFLQQVNSRDFKEFFEIEIEIDRSMWVQLQKLSQQTHGKALNKYLVNMQKLLQSDLQLLGENIRRELLKKPTFEESKLKNKLARVKSLHLKE